MEITIKEAKSIAYGEMVVVGGITIGFILSNALMVYFLAFYVNAFFILFLLRDALMTSESHTGGPLQAEQANTFHSSSKEGDDAGKGAIPSSSKNEPPQ